MAKPNVLTPEFCISTVQLRDFLRTSRSLDDSINQSLNALLSKSKSNLEPYSSSVIRSHSPARKQLSSTACQDFRQNVVFPSWHARDEVLEYCKSVSKKIEIEDENLLTRKNEEKVVDERLDPYSARPLVPESRAEILKGVLRQENQIESIVRARTWALVNERCVEDMRSWEQPLIDWKKHRDK